MFKALKCLSSFNILHNKEEIQRRFLIPLSSLESLDVSLVFHARLLTRRTIYLNTMKCVHDLFIIRRMLPK